MKYLKILLLISNLVLAGAQLGVANYRATDGDRVAKLESEAREITAANRQLDFQINTLTSLDTIRHSATAMGLATSTTTSFSSPSVAKIP